MGDSPRLAGEPSLADGLAPRVAVDAPVPGPAAAAEAPPAAAGGAAAGQPGRGPDCGAAAAEAATASGGGVPKCHRTQTIGLNATDAPRGGCSYMSPPAAASLARQQKENGPPAAAPMSAPAALERSGLAARQQQQQGHSPPGSASGHAWAAPSVGGGSRASGRQRSFASWPPAPAAADGEQRAPLCAAAAVAEPAPLAEQQFVPSAAAVTSSSRGGPCPPAGPRPAFGAPVLPPAAPSPAAASRFGIFAAEHLSSPGAATSAATAPNDLEAAPSATKKQAAEVVAGRGAPSAELTAAKTEATKLQAARDCLAEELAAARAQASHAAATHDAQVMVLVERLAVTHAEANQANQQAAQLAADLSKARNELAAFRTERDDFKAERANLLLRVKNLESEVSSRVMAARQAEAAAADERVQLESTLQAARESLERSNQEVGRQSTQLAQATFERNFFSSKLFEAEDKYTALEEAFTTQNDDMADLRRRFKDADDERMHLAGELKTAGQTIFRLNQDVTAAMNKCASLTSSLTSTQDELCAVKKGLAEADAARRSAEEQVSSERAMLTAVIIDERRQIISLQGEVASMAEARQLQADMVSKLNAELEAAGEKRRALEAQAAELTRESQKRAAQVADLHAANAELTNKFRALEASQRAGDCRTEELRSQLAALQEENRELAGQVEATAAQLDAAVEAHSVALDQAAEAAAACEALQAAACLHTRLQAAQAEARRMFVVLAEMRGTVKAPEWFADFWLPCLSARWRLHCAPVDFPASSTHMLLQLAGAQAMNQELAKVKVIHTSQLAFVMVVLLAIVAYWRML